MKNSPLDSTQIRMQGYTLEKDGERRFRKPTPFKANLNEVSSLNTFSENDFQAARNCRSLKHLNQTADLPLVQMLHMPIQQTLFNRVCWKSQLGI